MRRSGLRALGLAAAAVLAAPVTAAGAFDERPCEPTGFRCSSLSVPLDRVGELRGDVRLAVRRLPAADAPSATAFVVIVGGPGQAVTPLAGELAAALGTVRGPRDLVVFDPRGVGRSGPLRCRATTARACARELGRARGRYTTTDDVADLEAIRAAGGYERLAIYGTSYGTKVALQYAAAFPERVERLVLDSVVGPEGPDPLELSTYAAVRRALPLLCDGDAACRRPLRALERTLARLDRRTLRTRVPTGTGRRPRVRVTPVELVEILLAGDANPVIRAETPAALAAAARGDEAPLARLAARAAGIRGVARAGGDGINEIRNVTTICEELPFPWRRGASSRARVRELIRRVNRLPRSSFAPFPRETVLLAGLAPRCLRWPVASPPPPDRVDLPGGIPTLLLSGAQDLRTPVEDARAVAERLGSAARLVVVPHVGHSVLGSDPSGCAQAALDAFMRDAPVPGCAPTEPVIEAPGVPPRSLAAVAPYRGVGGRAGRTLAATSRTVADALRAETSALIEGSGPRIAGLRGGLARRTAAGLRLRRYSYVPGVTLSGFIPAEGAGALRLVVGGARAAHGRFTVAGGRIEGTLGGRRIDVPTSPPAARAAGASVRGGPATPPFPRLARIP